MAQAKQKLIPDKGKHNDNKCSPFGPVGTRIQHTIPTTNLRVAFNYKMDNRNINERSKEKLSTLPEMTQRDARICTAGTSTELQPKKT